MSGSKMDTHTYRLGETNGSNLANSFYDKQKEKTKQTPWFQSAKRTVPTERLPLVDEVSAHFSGLRVSRDQCNESQRPLISVF
jgi:hypothetical protein